jgi:ribosomal protein L11 methylase PrmA
MIDRVHPGSFRDPSGFVFTRDGELYRQVNQRHRQHYDAFLSTGLYDALVSRRLLIPHREVDIEAPDPEHAYRVLRPDRVEFISYPYEWSFSQLREAALLTLEVQQLALEHGMSLRDASAYNVQFHAGRPILIDTLSFETTPEGKPWSAYGQFCRHFLAPLVLMSYVDVRLGSLLSTHIDGIPLDLAAGLLPRRARLRPSLMLHIQAQARHRGDGVAKASSGTFSSRAFQGLLESLNMTVTKLSLSNEATEWSAYYEEADHYQAEDVQAKRASVEAAIDRTKPDTVWDLGANIGLFGRIAADRGINTVCFDNDHACVEANYRHTIEHGEEHVLPLLLDLTNPTPSTGWAHSERSSLVERGPADLILALALVHHLAIGNNVPLGEVARFFRLIGRWALVEFVPKEDPKVQALLTVREDIFDRYDVEGFEAAFQECFEVVDRWALGGSARSLYLMRAL